MNGLERCRGRRLPSGSQTVVGLALSVVLVSSAALAQTPIAGSPGTPGKGTHWRDAVEAEAPEGAADGEGVDSVVDDLKILQSGSKEKAALDALTQDVASDETLRSAPSDRAWAAGVSPERQKEARQRFLEGNALLRESQYREAEAKYRQALTLWDHPGVHYNLALSLINLDRPLEVRENLLAALRYGPAPLDRDRYDHVRSYLRLVEKQLAMIDVHFDLAGASVMLDGRLLFQAPGHYEGATTPGHHVVQVSKAGYVTREYPQRLVPGEPTRVSPRLYTDAQLTESKRRWNYHGPVLLAGAGALFLGAGTVFLLQSNAKYRGADRQAQATPEPSTDLQGNWCDRAQQSCAQAPELGRLRDTAASYRNLAIVGYAAGGAALVTGAVLMYLNRKYDVRITPEERDRRPLIQPVFGPGMAGLHGSVRF